MEICYGLMGKRLTMLNQIMLNQIMLSQIMLNLIMLNLIVFNPGRIKFNIWVLTFKQDIVNSNELKSVHLNFKSISC